MLDTGNNIIYSTAELYADGASGVRVFNDGETEEKVMRLLTEVNKEFGTTIIQVTHSEKVASYGNRIIRLKDGNIV